MDVKKYRLRSVTIFFVLVFIAHFSLAAGAEDRSVAAVNEAKQAIEEARRAGAEQRAPDDLAAAKSWLVQAEKALSDATSIISMIKTAKMKQAQEEEVAYLASMAMLKGRIAEARSKRTGVVEELKDKRKDLDDYKSALAVMKEKQAEAEKAREVQARAEEERRQLEESRQKAAEMEAQKKRELEEARLQAAKFEEQKRKELEEAQRKAAELEIKKERELQEARLQEAQRKAAMEKDAAAAKLQAERLAAQRAKEEIELKAREEKLSAERESLAALQARVQAMEREKTMLAEAAKISRATAKTGQNQIIITILAINIFNSSNELKSEGKDILDKVAKFLKSYRDNKIAVRGHTDSRGSATINKEVSNKRAREVREYLVAYGNVAPTRITAEGVGPSEPVASNASEAGRALNRRVDVIIFMGP